MGDAQHTFLSIPPPGTFTPGTPSGLTPNTRSEAEAALTLNSTTQTDSAAPTTPLPAPTSSGTMYPGMDASGGGGGGDNTTLAEDQTLDEAKRAYKRPPGVVRTSSSNYANALAAYQHEPSASSNMSTSSDSTSTSTTTATPAPSNITGTQPIASPMSATGAVFPPPGKGVVPLRTGVGSGQAEALKRVRPQGLSLGHLGRQQSWSEQDMKHVYSGALMGEVRSAGYDSGNEGKGA